jgi:hypothetical protein
MGSDRIALALACDAVISTGYFARLLLMSKPSIGLPSRLALTYRPVGDLIPDPRNARTHPKRQIEQLRASIEAFGFTNPILADPDGRIIAGHGRFQAARAMGLAEVPTIILSGLSEPQKRALRIADNKIALNAGWDLEILQWEMRELASIDVDIDPTLTGFSTGEIDVILSAASDPDDESFPQFRQRHGHGAAISGFSASTGLDVATAAMPDFCSGSSATERVPMRPSSIPPTMFVLGGMRWPWAAIASSRWPRVRWARRNSAPSSRTSLA